MELKITRDEWLVTWMLGRIKKRKRVDSHELQALQNVVKKGGEEVIKNFEDVFQEVRIEGKRMKSSDVNYTESYLTSTSSSTDLKETLYLGTASEARQRYQRSSSFRRNNFNRRRSQSRESRFNTPSRQSRYDDFKSVAENRDQL